MLIWSANSIETCHQPHRAIFPNNRTVSIASLHQSPDFRATTTWKICETNAPSLASSYALRPKDRIWSASPARPLLRCSIPLANSSARIDHVSIKICRCHCSSRFRSVTRTVSPFPPRIRGKSGSHLEDFLQSQRMKWKVKRRIWLREGKGDKPNGLGGLRVQW